MDNDFTIVAFMCGRKWEHGGTTFFHVGQIQEHGGKPIGSIANQRIVTIVCLRVKPINMGLIPLTLTLEPIRRVAKDLQCIRLNRYH